MAFDRAKFLRIAAMLGSSHAGERHNAADQSYTMLQAAGATWHDILVERSDDTRDNEIRIATEACEHLKTLLAERDARIAELERATGDWSSVPRVTVTSHKQAAIWLLELNSNERVYLSPRERGFVTDVSAWVGPLPPKMRDWFQIILDRTAQRTGLVPPP